MANPWDFTNVWDAHVSDYPTFQYESSDSIDGRGKCKYLSLGTVRKLVSSVSGLDYLNGQIVSIVADGQLGNPPQAIVSSGTINLLTPAAVVHVGLPYQGKVQFLPLGGDGQTVNESKERKVYDIVLRVFKSLSGMFGKDSDSLSPISYTESVNNNPDDDVLFTGDIHYVPFESEWDEFWQPTFVQEDPLPFMMLAAIIRSEISEDK